MTRITQRTGRVDSDLEGDSDESLGELVLARGKRIDLRPGKVLFREGDPSAAVYACVHGRIKLTIATPAGNDLLLGIKMPCQAFGELSALDGRGRSASATAMEPCRVAVLPRSEFLEALDDSPRLAVALLRELSDHLRLANLRTSSRNGDSTPVRVGQRLLELAAQFARHGQSGAHVILPITQSDLAAWVGATRESTARALGQYRQAGLLRTGRGHITIINADALSRSLAG